MKRKRVNYQQEGEEQNTPKNDILLDDMDLDVDIENIGFHTKKNAPKKMYGPLDWLFKMKSSLMKKPFLYIMFYLISLQRD